ncbi:MAG: hypothetical protein WD249_09310 [Gaiellaceae bacterium]
MRRTFAAAAAAGAIARGTIRFRVTQYGSDLAWFFAVEVLR